MDSSNRLASFLDSIKIKSDVEKKVRDFPHSTAVAFFQELESNTTDNNEKKYIVELLFYYQDTLNKHIIYEGLEVEKAKTEYQKLVSLLDVQNEDFFIHFNWWTKMCKNGRKRTKMYKIVLELQKSSDIIW